MNRVSVCGGEKIREMHGGNSCKTIQRVYENGKFHVINIYHYKEKLLIE